METYMIYAMPRTTPSATELVVGAAQTTEKFEMWFEHVSGGRVSSIQDSLIDPIISKFRHPVYIFEFKSDTDRDAFVDTHDINTVGGIHLIDYHNDMMEFAAPDPMLDNSKTISEEYDLDASDKWDERTEAEKTAAKDHKAKVDNMAKRAGGAMTGSSFDPNMGGGSSGTFDIGTITVDGSNVSVKATKRAGVTTTSDSEPSDPFVRDEDDSTPTDEMIADLGNAVFDQFGKDRCYTFIESDFGDRTIGELRNIIRSAILNAKIEEALIPVTDATDIDAAVDVVRGRIEAISDLSPEEVAAVMESAEEKMRAPRPSPSDFIIFENAKLTASDGMRGEGIPIIHIVKSETNEHFPVNECIPYFEEYGLSMVSSGLFSYEVRNTDVKYESDIMAFMANLGFAIDPAAMPAAIMPTLAAGGTLTSEEVAKALAGNGTTTVEGTGSFGKHQIGKSEEDYANDIDLGVVGDVGASIPQDANLTLTAWEDLPDYLQTAYDTFDTHPSKVLFGDFAGMTLADAYTVLSLSDGDTLWKEASANIRVIGGAKTDTSESIVVQRDNPAAVGIIAITSGNGAVKIYRLK